ncbi:hypothetical protein ACF1AX_10580 [Streptomyces sp. NPDC014802]|uniref:hypothetical protein n=1 Tax=unclassified Streptomyces TaxID=2593676 RepID=UPI0036F55406
MFLGILVLYVFSRWVLAWQQARREGDPHPVRAAVAEEDDQGAVDAAVRGGFRSYRQFFGFVGGAVVVVLVAVLTDGRVRLALLWTVVPLLVVALAYLDFRQARKARARA